MYPQNGKGVGSLRRMLGVAPPGCKPLGRGERAKDGSCCGGDDGVGEVAEEGKTQAGGCEERQGCIASAVDGLIQLPLCSCTLHSMDRW